jgi:hypothetical protein
MAKRKSTIGMLWKVHCNNNMAWFNLFMGIILVCTHLIGAICKEIWKHI